MPVMMVMMMGLMILMNIILVLCDGVECNASLLMACSCSRRNVYCPENLGLAKQWSSCETW